MSGRVPRHVLRDDLVSAGMLGLAQAAKSWDPERGVTFERYARTRIQGALLDELRGRDWASRSVRANARRLREVSDEIAARTGEHATPKERAWAMDLQTAQLNKPTADVPRAPRDGRP